MKSPDHDPGCNLSDRQDALRRQLIEEVFGAVGANTVVGAGAVVARDLTANVVAVGNPARVIKHLGDATS